MPPGLWLWWRADLRGGWYAECDEGRVALVRLPSWRDDPASDKNSEEGSEDEEEEEEKAVRIFRAPGGRAEGSIEDVLIDPGQDLVVLITRTPDGSCLTVHFLTLHGLPHPSAHAPTLTYLQTWAGDFPGVKLFASSLSRSLLAIVVLSFLGRTRLNELVVWDWRTGCERRRKTGWRHYETLAFIAERSIVAGCMTGAGPTLDVYTIDADADDAPSAQKGPEDDGGIHLSHSLALPQLREEIRLSLHFSPNRSTPAPTAYPWYCPPTQQLLAVTLRPSRVTSRVAESGLYMLFLLASTLLHPPGLDTLPLPSLEGEPEPEAPPIPWPAWGPEHTRLIPLDPLPHPSGTGFTHNTRAVFPLPASAGSAKFCIVDFSSHALLRDPHAGDVREEEVLPRNPFWQGEVVTRLPYRRAETDEREGLVVWAWLDEERLVLVRREDLGTGEGGGRVLRSLLEVLIM
ncbi:hypothetical protein CALVIDRAFT_534709 [Calocera viscosa TUFC12733]|uniref:Uncharacterized protein n=1 Tax=Calocera viscosa (strain TUFC12733) TaxID=1330018 RepID=A0A167PVN2_CALVF|nr:hypothetical protein CALVIDRAFT_534709 [Calocera viscosa TUFC12733]